MSAIHELALHVFQAELAYPQPPIWKVGVLFGKRRVVPCLNVVLSEANGPYPLGRSTVELGEVRG